MMTMTASENYQMAFQAKDKPQQLEWHYPTRLEKLLDKLQRAVKDRRFRDMPPRSLELLLGEAGDHLRELHKKSTQQDAQIALMQLRLAKAELGVQAQLKAREYAEHCIDTARTALCREAARADAAEAKVQMLQQQRAAADSSITELKAAGGNDISSSCSSMMGLGAIKCSPAAVEVDDDDVDGLHTPTIIDTVRSMASQLSGPWFNGDGGDADVIGRDLGVDAKGGNAIDGDDQEQQAQEDDNISESNSWTVAADVMMCGELYVSPSGCGSDAEGSAASAGGDDGAWGAESVWSAVSGWVGSTLPTSSWWRG